MVSTVVNESSTTALEWARCCDEDVDVMFIHQKAFETLIAKISVTSPIVINMSTRELLAGETKSSFV